MDLTSTIAKFFHDVDRQDWAAIRAGLADEVDTDYTSLFGGEPERLTGDALVDRWQGLLPGFDGTQHLLGPVAVLTATTAECNVRAYHRLDGETWMVAGRYELGVTAGRVDRIVLHTTYQDGEPGLVQRATSRIRPPDPQP